MTATFSRHLMALAQIADLTLVEPWTWVENEGRDLQVRNRLYQCLERELAAACAVPAEMTLAARSICQTQRAWGDLRGLVAGLGDDDLDRSAEPGEWNLRQVLGHILLTDRRYRGHMQYALARAEADPMRFEQPEVLEEGESEGGVLDWIDRIDSERQLVWALRTIAGPDLDRPTVWSGHNVDLRFRLHRFGGHVSEHTIQAEKVLAALGHQPSEVQRIVRRISAARAEHELITPNRTLEELDSKLPA
ncbi:MAG: DinB family protein [Candidatus Dormibacteraceae bacterium]